MTMTMVRILETVPILELADRSGPQPLKTLHFCGFCLSKIKSLTTMNTLYFESELSKITAENTILGHISHQ